MTMPFEQAAAWGQGGFEPRGDGDEARVRRDFWRKAARVAAELKQALGVDAKLEVGSSGEFTVWVDDSKVAEKKWARFPDPADVVSAVRAQLSR